MNPVGRFFLKMFVGIYRLSNGRVFGSMPGGMEVLILKTTGKRTGKVRETPITYLRDGQNYVIIASNGGAPKNPGWWFNLNAQSNASIEIKGRTMPVTFRPATVEERERLWPTLPAGYHSYRSKTTREIPFAVLTPVT